MAKPVISVIVPVHDGSGCLDICLRAIFASRLDEEYECIVVDDASTDDSAHIANQFPVRLLTLSGEPHGPAYARNRGAAVATGNILFFVDADVAIQPDTLGKTATVLRRAPDVDAVFGSYDNLPAAMDFVSQYKNLSHHFVHQQAHEEGGTFWSGCGAVRRDVFMKIGGFDEVRYPRPSVEDIELGYRLKAAGHRILLDKGIQGKHLKQWSLRRMVESDLFDRAIPWTLLIFRDRNLPNDLNLGIKQRVSALLVCLAFIDLAVTALLDSPGVAILALLAIVASLVAGYWRWPDARAPIVSRRAELVTCVLVAAIVAIATNVHHVELVPFVLPVPVGVLAGYPRLHLQRLRGPLFFSIVVLGLLAAGVLELVEQPSWLLAPLPVSVGLVVVLNRNLYAFFARERGFLFAICAVPLHLQYYLYSTLALGVGACIHVWNIVSTTRRIAQTKPGHGL